VAVDTKTPGSADIDASKGHRRVLIQVKSALTPNAPPGLSSAELRNLKSRASRIGAEAWLAQVNLSPANLARVGDINFTQL